MHNSKSNVIKNIFILIAFVLYMISFLFWYSTVDFFEVSFTGYAELIFPWLLIAMAIQLISFLFVKKVRYIDIGLWFVVLSYLFMYGNVFVEVFNMQTVLLWNPIASYTNEELLESAVYVNCCVNMLSLGYLINYRPIELYNKSDVLQGNLETDNEQKYYIGKVLIFIGFTCSLITSLNLISVTQAYGSYTAYAQAGSAGLIDDFAFLFVPGIIYVLVSRKLDSFKGLLLTGFSILYFLVVMMLSGSRKTQIFAILALVLCFLWVYRPKKLGVGKTIVLLILGTVFLDMIYIIREYRTDLDEVIPAFFDSLTNFEVIGNLLGETLTETGISFCAVASIIKCVPTVFPYEYGMTILRTIPSFLPIGWLFPDFFNKASSTIVINQYLNLPVGDSLYGDFYWNWGGFFGAFAALILGVVFSNMFKKLKAGSTEVYFSVLYIVLIGVRAGIFELFRPLFMVVFIPWLLKLILRKRNKVTSYEKSSLN